MRVERFHHSLSAVIWKQDGQTPAGVQESLLLQMKRLFFGLLLFSMNSAWALPELDVNEKFSEATLENYLRVLEDGGKKLTIADVQKGQVAESFQPVFAPTPNPGYSRSAFWATFVVRNTGDKDLSLNLELGYPLLDDIQLYVLDDKGGILEKRAGRTAGVTDENEGRLFVFPLNFPADSRRTVYVRVESEDSIILPITLYSEGALSKKDHTRQYLFGIYYGIILVMIVYNLFVFVFMRERVYLYYVLTLLCLHGFFQLALNGYAREVFHSSLAWWSRDSIAFFQGAGVLFALFFCRDFLNIRRIAPRLSRIFYFLMAWALVNMGIALSGSYRIAILSCVFQGTLAIIAALTAGILSIRRRFRPARFYMTAWSVLLLGAFIYVLKIWGFLPSNLFTEYTWQLGSAMEATLLSLALADRIVLMRQERSRAQHDAHEQRQLAMSAQTDLLNHLSRMESLNEFAVDVSGRSLERLLENILATFGRVLNFEKGFIVISDRSGKGYVKTIGDFPEELLNVIPDDKYLQKLLKLSPELFEEVNRIFILEDGQRTAFTDDTRRTEREVVSVLTESLKILEKFGFYLVIPLSYEREIFGYIMVGRRKDGQAYTPTEMKITETFRLSIAMAIRNAVLYEEVGRLRGKAEEKATRLSDYIIEMRETVRRDIQEKTLVYTSQAMYDVLDSIKKYASRPLPVLITGETGTGKELVARTIHEESGLGSRPFVAVNCAAVPRELWESEIFGHMKGAFSDAKADRPGKVEQAADGTLFFDEIGEMPVDIQPKLLRLIQERSYSRIGGEKVFEASCRFVFATNRDLRAMMSSGVFREDLYYRISVFSIQVPSLRERPEDIPALVDHFVARYGVELSSPVKGVERSAMEKIVMYRWPGNIRELENCLIQSIVNCASEMLGVSDLPAHIAGAAAGSPSGGAMDEKRTANPDQFGPFDELVERYSRDLIERALQFCGGNKQEAAKLLRIKRATFYYKLRELGIE